MPFLAKDCSLNLKDLLQRERGKTCLHGQKLRLILTNMYYSNIFILFMDDRGSTCHHAEMREEKTGRLMGQGGRVWERGIDLTDSDRNFHLNLEASPRPEVRRAKF